MGRHGGTSRASHPATPGSNLTAEHRTPENLPDQDFRLPPRVVMVEALSADLSVESLMQYYDVCDFAFNFNLIVHLFEPLTAEDLNAQIHDWLDNLPAGKTANWVVRNQSEAADEAFVIMPWVSSRLQGGFYLRPMTRLIAWPIALLC